VIAVSIKFVYRCFIRWLCRVCDNSSINSSY